MGRSCAVSDEALNLNFDHDNSCHYSQPVFGLTGHLPPDVRKNAFQGPHSTNSLQKFFSWNVDRIPSQLLDFSLSAIVL